MNLTWISIKKTVNDHDSASRSAVKQEATDDGDDDDDLLVKKGPPPTLSASSTCASASAAAVTDRPEPEMGALPTRAEVKAAPAPEVDLTQLDERDREVLLYDFILNRRYSSENFSIYFIL